MDDSVQIISCVDRKLKMENILQQFGLNPFEIVAILLALFFAKELWSIFKTYRIKASYEYLCNLINEIDCQLKEFYLPLRERFITSKLLFKTTSSWLIDGEYKNESFKIVSDDEKALRKIAVWKIFLPFNREIKRIILECSHRKNINDKTNYEKILEHIMIWISFEESIQEGCIYDYDGENFLHFPADEAESCIEMCNLLLENKRKAINQVLQLGVASKKLLFGKS